MKHLIRTVLFCGIIIISGVALGAQTTFGIQGGLSAMSGDGSEYWNSGFSIGVNFFTPFDWGIKVGAVMTYNRFTPDEDELLRGVPPMWGVSWSIGGTGSIISLTPTVRIIVPMESVDLFFNIGAGFYKISLDATVKAYVMGSLYDQINVDDSGNSLGMNLGGGLSLKKLKGLSIELFPSLHIMMKGGESTTFFTVNLGISFNARSIGSTIRE